MRAVGLKVLKNKLSEFVRLASQGETILVTDRDRVVAELGPPGEEHNSRVADATLAEAVRKGWMSPPILRGTEPCPRLPVARWSELRAELERDREDR
jgi:antitoxin (DNA-binding transcriptional repressor) of toxin-antitoxin stability system